MWNIRKPIAGTNTRQYMFANNSLSASEEDGNRLNYKISFISARLRADDRTDVSYMGYIGDMRFRGLK